jgi:hypothetical protein
MVKPAFPKLKPANKRSAGYGMATLVWMATIIAMAGCAVDPLTTGASPEVVGEPQRVGNLANPQLKEVSGLAASSLFPSLLWAINDGGDDPLLYAVGTDGADLGAFRVEGAKNIDWEALASFRLQDKAYLLIADVGDNWEQRQTATLYIVEEPSITATGLNSNITVPISWQIHFTYEDGPQDCEAAAVDPVKQRVLLLTKRGLSPLLYELPLQPAGPDAPELARPLASINHFNGPTDMDLSPDGLSAVVLTYNHAYLFKRRPKDDWPTAFQRKPQRLLFETLSQQEAICFGYYGKSVWITSERQPAPLVRIDLDE